MRTAARGRVRTGKSAEKLALPSASRRVASSFEKLGSRRRFSSPKRKDSQPLGANGASSNMTAASTGSPFAGPPKRCSAEILNVRLDGCCDSSAAILTILND